MSVGDVCYIRPQAYVVGTGHARYQECVTVDLAQSDLTFIGTGYPRNNEFGVRMKAAAAQVYCFDISGPSCHIENIGLFSDGGTYTLYARNNGTTATQRGSDGIVLYNVNSKGSPLYINGGQAARVIECVFHYATAAQLVIASPSASGYNQQIRNCSFLDNNGAQTTGPYLSASGAHVYSLIVDHSWFQQVPSGGKYIVMGGTLNTGIISDCFFEDDDVTIASHMTLGGTEMRMIGCHDLTGEIAS
jgi:hypothetical protein